LIEQIVNGCKLWHLASKMTSIVLGWAFSAYSLTNAF